MDDLTRLAYVDKIRQLADRLETLDDSDSKYFIGMELEDVGDRLKIYHRKEVGKQ